METYSWLLEPNYREEKTAGIEKTMPREELVALQCLQSHTKLSEALRGEWARGGGGDLAVTCIRY